MAERALGKGARTVLALLAQPGYSLEYAPGRNGDGAWHYLWTNTSTWAARYRDAQVGVLYRRNLVAPSGPRRWTITQAGRDVLAEGE